MKKYLKVSDSSPGDLFKIREDTNYFPNKFHRGSAQGGDDICLRWGSENPLNLLTSGHNLLGKILIYVGKQRLGRFLYHKFICEDQELFTRGRNFRFLRKL